MSLRVFGWLAKAHGSFLDGSSSGPTLSRVFSSNPLWCCKASSFAFLKRSMSSDTDPVRVESGERLSRPSLPPAQSRNQFQRVSF
jgi:hypothetical protein